MNEARKALINIQKASPGLPVGRFHPQLAIIADFFDTLVATTTERDNLHRQLAEAHECFGTLLAEMATPPASVPDQAKQGLVLRDYQLKTRAEVVEKFKKVGVTGNSFGLLIIDDIGADGTSGIATVTINATEEQQVKISSAKPTINRDDTHRPLANLRLSERLPPPGFKMSSKAQGLSYHRMIYAGWSAATLEAHGYLVPDHA